MVKIVRNRARGQGELGDSVKLKDKVVKKGLSEKTYKEVLEESERRNHVAS